MQWFFHHQWQIICHCWRGEEQFPFHEMVYRLTEICSTGYEHKHGQKSVMKQLARLVFQGTLNSLPVGSSWKLPCLLFRIGLTWATFWLLGKQLEERDLFTIIVIYFTNTSIFCFISEVGTGSSSHDFDVGSNKESLQCGSLCGCVCDRMTDTGGKERRMF